VRAPQPTGSVLLFHAEFDEHAHDPAPAPAPDSAADPTLYSTFLASRPPTLETAAIARIVALQTRVPSLRCHIVHLSAASALPQIRAARAAGARLTVETCFPYLCLSAADVPRAAPQYKCCPPIRDGANRDALWAALGAGEIDCVVSDHSPCVAELKRLGDGDFMGAWGGISTLGLGLGLLWTEARARGFGVCDVVRWVCERTAAHAGLEGSKGQLAVGLDADLVLWDADADVVVRVVPSCVGSGRRCVRSRSRRTRSTSRTNSRHTRGARSKAAWSAQY
jgi:allantoinase